jgi:hypothetical protein
MKQKKVVVFDKNTHYFPLKDYSSDKLEIKYCSDCEEGLKKIIDDNYDGVVLNLDTLPLEGHNSPYNLILKSAMLHNDALIFLNSYNPNLISEIKTQILQMSEFEEMKYLKHNLVDHHKTEGIVPFVEKIYINLNL